VAYPWGRNLSPSATIGLINILKQHQNKLLLLLLIVGQTHPSLPSNCATILKLWLRH